MVDKNAVQGISSIAVDSDNNPHVAYSDYENGNYHLTENLMYASWNGSEWITQTVTSEVYCIDFKLDFNDNPDILGGDTRISTLYYISWTGANWTIQPINNQARSVASLALDSTGNPHVVYTARGDYYHPIVLKYANRTDSRWNIETVDLSEDIAHIVSLALDTNNNPHIFYGYYKNNHGDSPSTPVKYVVWVSGSGWTTQIISSDVPAGGYGNVVLDSNDYPHIIYAIAYPKFSGGNTTLIHDSWNGSVWTSQAVASNFDLQENNGIYLKLDSHNYPCIVFFNETPNSYNSGDLIYSRWKGTNWSSQIVESNRSISVGPIALDSFGNPHISYLARPSLPNSHNAYLMYATTTKTTTIPAPTSDADAFAIVVQTLPIVAVVLAVIIVSLFFFGRHQRPKQRNSGHKNLVDRTLVKKS